MRSEGYRVVFLIYEFDVLRIRDVSLQAIYRALQFRDSQCHGWKHREYRSLIKTKLYQTLQGLN